MGRLAEGVSVGQPRRPRRTLAGRVPHEPGVAFSRAPWRVRSVARGRPDGAERRQSRPLFPADARCPNCRQTRICSPPRTAAAAFFDSAERLVIDTLAGRACRFRQLRQRVLALGEELDQSACRRASCSILPRWRCSTTVRRLADIIGSADAAREHVRAAALDATGEHLRAIGAVVDRRLAIVDPSCLITKGLPDARAVRRDARRLVDDAPLDVDSDPHRGGRTGRRHAHRRSDAAPVPLGRSHTRRPGTREQRGWIRRTDGSRLVGRGRRARGPPRR